MSSRFGHAIINMKKKIILPKTPPQKIAAELRKRAFENLKNIQAVEDFFLKTRGYVFKMPKQGTPVIVLVSGGLDSIITWAILLEKYRLKTYPLFIFRDTKRSPQEWAAVDFFAKYFAKKYPTLVQPPMKFSAGLLPPELKAVTSAKNYYHPQRLLEQIAVGETAALHLPAHPQLILPFLPFFYSLIYSEYLQDRFLEKVTTVFTGFMVGDGTVVPSQSLTSLRNALLSACNLTSNYDFQYTSLALEKELGFWFKKSDFIKIGHQLKIPLEKTWTCSEAGKNQCGQCFVCLSRKQEFRAAQVPDLTLYQSDQKNLKWYLQQLKKIITMSGVLKIFDRVS